MDKKRCPFAINFRECIEEKCMAYHKKLNLEELQNSEGYDALIKLIAMQEGCYEKDAELIIETRNKTYCKLIGD